MTRRPWIYLVLIGVPVLLSGLLAGVMLTDGMPPGALATADTLFFWFNVSAGVAILALGFKPPRRYLHARATVWQTLALASGPLLPVIAQVTGTVRPGTERLWMVELVAKTLFLVGISSYLVTARRASSDSTVSARHSSVTHPEA